jgi:tRNA(Ile)-lysidine synthase
MAELTDPALFARFAGDFERLAPDGGNVGVAVSGGPDSLALLLLAASARPGRVEAATVDHRLRPESADESKRVAEVCGRLGIPHTILPVTVSEGASVQALAREARYKALTAWASDRSLAAVLTAHHSDDQAETLLMRLARGAGLAGLAGVRPSRELAPGLRLLRPLLGWRKATLVEIVRSAGLLAADDPSNRDRRHDRTRVRAFMEEQQWLNPERVAASAGHLAEAEVALTWSAGHLAEERLQANGQALLVDPSDLPQELRRRLLIEAMRRLGAATPRGPDVARALERLSEGGSCSLGGLLLRGGQQWRLEQAPSVIRRPEQPE